MSTPSTMTVEAHDFAATLYASGDLNTAAIRHALANVDRLPNRIRALSVDLRAIRRTDSRALRTLEIFLRRWRSERRGMSRVQLPENAITTVVAIKFTHKRWAPSRPAVTGSS